MRKLYNFLLYLAAPFVLLRLLWRSRRLKAYRYRWSERFAYFKLPDAAIQNGIWVHAVSVGEVILAAPLIRRFRQEHPDIPFVITTMTPTGSEQVKTHFNDPQIFHVYAPYDLPNVVLRFLNQVKPRLAIMIETELWPNIIYYCHQQKIPLLVANARLSQRSADKYARFGTLTKKMLSGITMIIAQTQADADRYIRLGLSPEKICVTGSMKFDIQLPASLRESAEVLRQQWGVDRPVWIAASTHEGEEEIILQAFTIIRKSLPNALLVLAPRHPDRFARVNNLCQKQQYRTITRSSGKPCDHTTPIFIGDTLGELILFYAAADVAFVGGSLIPNGGHNLLEPAALGLPIVSGPNMFNFEEISRLLREAGALRQVKDAAQLAEAVLFFLQDVAERAQAGENGCAIVKKNRGALDAHLRILNTHYYLASST